MSEKLAGLKEKRDLAKAEFRKLAAFAQGAYEAAARAHEAYVIARGEYSAAVTESFDIHWAEDGLYYEGPRRG